jgi:hypothetical protein
VPRLRVDWTQGADRGERHDGQRKPFREGKYGDSLHRLTGEWNRREMTIGRENDRYIERVVDGETGVTIHECDEPLSKHQGHGSTKRTS